MNTETFKRTINLNEKCGFNTLTPKASGIFDIRLSCNRGYLCIIIYTKKFVRWCENIDKLFSNELCMRPLSQKYINHHNNYVTYQHFIFILMNIFHVIVVLLLNL